jgi:hypothetical protein
MTPRRTLGLVLVSGALVAATTACPKRIPDPRLTPPAQLASTNGELVNALDLIRNGALLFVNDAGTGQLPLPLARRLVQVHESSLKLIDVRSDGFITIIQTSLAAVIAQLPPEANRKVSPYFALASTLLDVLASQLGLREIDEQLSAEVIAAYKSALASSLAFDARYLAEH